MENKNIKAVLAKSLQEELTPEEKVMLYDWLNESEENKKIYAGIRDVDTLSKIARLAPVSDTSRRRLLRGNMIRVAAIALLLIMPACTLIYFGLLRSADIDSGLTEQAGSDVLFISGNSIYNLSRQSGQEQLKEDLPAVSVAGDELKTSAHQEDAVRMNRIVVPRGKTFHVVLTDGTRVTLNAMSELRFPSDFRTEERVVELKGEAFFEVTKKSARKFTVKMGDNRIRVLGTKFNASSYQDQPAFVSLIEGKVEALTNREARIISPGEQAVFPQTATAITVGCFNADEVLGWKNDIFFFEDRPLQQIVQALERWYDVRFEFSAENLKQIDIYLRIRKSRSLDDILRALETTNKITFEQTERIVRILPGK